MKRIMSLMLAVLMVVALFVGCQPKEVIVEKIVTSIVEVEKEVTVPVEVIVEKTLENRDVYWMMREIGLMGANPEPIILEWFEMVGNMNIIPVLVSPDVYMEKLSIMVAGNEIPDMVNVGNQDIFIEAVVPDFYLIQDIATKGMLVSLTDNMDKLPHYKYYLDMFPDYVGSITASDGDIYFASTVRDYNPTASLGGVIRTDLIEDVSFDSFDELLAVLTDLRGKRDGPVWTNRSGILNLNLLSYSFGTSLIELPYYEQFEKKYINPVATQNFKDAVIFFKTLVERDILTPEWSSYPEPQWYEDSMKDVCLFWVDNMMNVPTMNNGLATNGIDGKFEAFIPPAYNGVKYGWAGKSRFSTTGTVISSKSEAIDNCLVLIDWLYDQKNHDLMYWGLEGVTAKRLSNGSMGNIEEGYQKTDEFVALANKYGVGENSNWMKVFTDVEYYDDRWFDGARLWYPAGKVYGDNVYNYSIPSTVLNEEQMEVVKNIKTPLDTFVQENVTNFINGVRDISEFDAFVKEVEAMKINELVDIYNDAIGK